MLRLTVLVLYLTHCDHLFAQVVLVFPNRTVPASDGFVFAHEDVFGDFVEEAVGGYC